MRAEEWDRLHDPVTCDVHNFRCWKCGETQTPNDAALLGRFITVVIVLLVLGVVVSPLLWLLRVCWSWAL